MSSLEAIYLKLPIPLQHAACSLEGRRIKRSRFGSDFSLLLEQAEARTFWSEEQVSRYRDQRLRDFVDHCARTVPFYRRRFQEFGISAGDIRTLDDLRHLPIITKQDVQESCGEFVSDAISDRQREITHTSGTTGAGLRFFTTMRGVQEQWSTWSRYR